MTIGRTSLISLAALIVLVGTLAWLGVLRNPNAPVGPSTYSRSAIGHAGLLKLLQLHGVRAEASEGASRAKVRQGGLLVLAEPAAFVDPMELRSLLSAPRVLLVLPKWTGIADSDMPGWIAAASRLPLLAPNAILETAFPRNPLIRGLINLPAPGIWHQNALQAPPDFDSPVQLFTGSSIDPLVATPSGMLLGVKRRPRSLIYVLTDPDIISNHGLAIGNARFALDMIDRARAGGPVIFDETIHGFRTTPRNRALAIFSAPFAAATLAALVAIGLLAWADGARFGAPLPRPGMLPPGQLALIGAIAGLLDRGGHQKTVLARYVRGTVQDVLAGLQRSQIEGPARLAEAEQRRGTSIRAADLLREAAEAETGRPAHSAMAALALRAYTWKQEMGHGPAGHPRDV